MNGRNKERQREKEMQRAGAQQQHRERRTTLGVNLNLYCLRRTDEGMRHTGEKEEHGVLIHTTSANSSTILTIRQARGPTQVYSDALMTQEKHFGCHQQLINMFTL